jgi:hypothetical protein
MPGCPTAAQPPYARRLLLLLILCCCVSQVLNDPLVLAFSALTTSSAAYQQPADAAAESLPPQVHLLTAKWLSCDTVLVRFSHMFQPKEHPTLSQPASVQLAVVAKLLRLSVTKVQDATLWLTTMANDLTTVSAPTSHDGSSHLQRHLQASACSATVSWGPSHMTHASSSTLCRSGNFM